MSKGCSPELRPYDPRPLVVGMSSYLTDRKRPELSVVVGTDGKVSTRWEK